MSTQTKGISTEPSPKRHRGHYPSKTPDTLAPSPMAPGSLRCYVWAEKLDGCYSPPLRGQLCGDRKDSGPSVYSPEPGSVPNQGYYSRVQNLDTGHTTWGGNPWMSNTSQSPHFSCDWNDLVIWILGGLDQDLGWLQLNVAQYLGVTHADFISLLLSFCPNIKH